MCASSRSGSSLLDQPRAFTPYNSRQPAATDLSWTCLVPQPGEDFGGVGGDGGFGLELLAGELDGDVLQGA